MNDVAEVNQRDFLGAHSRLPLRRDIADELGIQPSDWMLLINQVFPLAKSVDAILLAYSYCKVRKLDVFKKPVHIVPMYSAAAKGEVETVWPGIAEIRTTAARTGQYAGIDAIEYGPTIKGKFTGTVSKWVDPEDGGKAQKKNVQDTVELDYPEWASVVVYKMVQGVRCPFHAKVYWKEAYASIGKSTIPNEMWRKRVHGQIDKCTEAAALRMAFPEEVGSMYAAEEMEGRQITDAGDVPSVPVAAKKAAPPPPDETKAIESKPAVAVDTKPKDEPKPEPKKAPPPPDEKKPVKKAAPKPPPQKEETHEEREDGDPGPFTDVEGEPIEETEAELSGTAGDNVPSGGDILEELHQDLEGADTPEEVHEIFERFKPRLEEEGGSFVIAGTGFRNRRLKAIDG